jgi:hypothetical protein
MFYYFKGIGIIEVLLRLCLFTNLLLCIYLQVMNHVLLPVAFSSRRSSTSTFRWVNSFDSTIIKGL